MAAGVGQLYIHPTLSGSRQWLPPARRHVHSGLYLPSQRSQTLSLAVAIDTSGSCQRDLPHFHSELKGILDACDRVSLDIMEFDTRITRRCELHEGQLNELKAGAARAGETAIFARSSPRWKHRRLGYWWR